MSSSNISTQALPIDDLLPALEQQLRAQPLLVLSAPPGAGKTTRIPLALLAAPWLAGKQIVMLEPRRLAAKAAARRLAALLEERDYLAEKTRSSDMRLRLHALCTGTQHAGLAARTRRAAQQLFQLCGAQGHIFADALKQEDSCGVLLSLAWPERLAQQCGKGRFRLRGGRAASLPESDSLAREGYLAIAALDAARERIFLAAPLPFALLEKYYAAEISTHNGAVGHARSSRVSAAAAPAWCIAAA